VKGAVDAPVLVWDLPTRLFHWLLAVLIALQYGSGEFGWPSMQWHYRFGYATLALLMFRVSWGVAGSQTSRFTDFVRGPRALWRYVSALVRGDEGHGAGHNPLGGWSVVLMLASIAVQAISGLFSSDDISEDGPLVARASAATVGLMTRIHLWNRYVLLVLVALHLTAIALYWVMRGNNLAGPMLHGRMRLNAGIAPQVESTWRALLLLVLAIAVVWGLVAWGDAG
jgi:cytochrome b